MLRTPLRAAALLVALAPTSSARAAPAQDAPSGQAEQPARPSREQTWYAPSAEDWRKPVLIRWQRTWEDALAVAKESGKPLLVCVNMDGEPASEHYAGVRYRQPEIAALYEPYVCVIASVYRHTPRDFDEQGRRIPCPRFGTVTCGEHVRIEPILYERFFDERRIAPRHVMVELDGSESYDVYYANDTASVFRAVREGVADRPTPPPPRADLSEEELLASADSAHREEVERLYREGDRARRRRLLEAAARITELDDLDLLRLALFGFDVELARLARQTLARSDSEQAVELIAEVLRAPLAAEERELLVAALERLGASWPRARTLAAVFRGLDARSDTIDVERWSEALARTAVQVDEPSRAQYALASRLERTAAQLADRPADPATRLAEAEASLELALAQPERSRYARVLLEDARRAAEHAEQLGASGFALDATLALACARLERADEALGRAEKAIAELPPEAQDWRAAEVLALFAQGRREAIARAARAGESWPPEWLSDVHAAYAVLTRHPRVREEQVLAQVDFLGSLGAREPAARALADGLARFPSSWLLHARLRAQALAEHGPAGLERAYEALLARHDASASTRWYAGYASLVAAEFRRRAGEPEEALAAYARALALLEAAAREDPSMQASADHYAALALAGRARLALERGELDLALDELLASLARSPSAAASQDGLNLSPLDTARGLRARLVEGERSEQAARLQAALDALDPQLLRPPEYERELPGARDAQRFPRRRQTPPARDASSPPR